MKLKQLLNEMNYQVLQGDLNQEVSQIDYDSRTVQDRSLFVCIPGANVDGHDFIDQVINRGARVIVVEHDVPFQEGITYIRVKEARLALALLSCAFFEHPSRQMTVIGITGTKGKTTTSYMMESILEKANKKVGIIGTIGSIVNGEFQKTKNTTPESFELQRLMRQMVECGCEYCVMEVSSQGLMLNRVAGIDFDYGVFTNLSPDHIGEHEHHSFEHYMACKKMLFQMCKVGIFNRDDEHYEDMIKEHQGWELVGIYADEGISGTSLQHRDEFNRMIEDCKAGKIDLIVTKSVSRFARNIVDCIAKVRELGNMRPKVGVFFETEHIYTLDNTSEMMLAVLSAAAQEESHTKSEIMNISIEQRFSRGIFLTPKLLGYDVDEDGNLVINKEEAETVRLCYYLFLNGFPTAEIAEILMQLKRKTKLGNTKWSSGTVGSLLRNERYCGDVLSRKTFTPNYLDHKSKKNRHDRNQYRQTNHHEAIVDRDIYNAAQKMLTVTKYAKKGFPFPNLKVVDGGALKGFVSVNRSWTGFTVEDYKKASQSVYSDKNSIQDSEESREEKKEGGFDLSGYEIVRAQFFSTRLNPAMTISEGRITFNTACLKKFEDVEYVEILFNSIERCIAVRPCDRDNINAVKWGTIRNGKWAVLPKSCRGFSEPLFELMDWNNECKYRFRGQYSKEDNEQILLFDLEEPEVIKHEIIQEDLPDTNTTEAEENTVETSENKTKKIVRTLFPKQWQNHFGDSSEDVLLLHRVKYYGNWDVLRPAKIVEGLEPISENLLDKLNEEAQNMIEKMRCAV